MRLIALAAVMSLLLGTAVPVAASEATVIDAVKRCVAQEIAGINAHDPQKAAACEATDTISMQSGRPASIGRDNYVAGLKTTFQQQPAWRLRLLEDAVDVPRSQEIAVYRSIYFQDSIMAGMLATQQVNYIALFRKQPDGSWKIAWSALSNIEKPHVP